MRSILYFACLVAHVAAAAPSARPLPPGITGEDRDFHVLRDHVSPRRFHLVPRRADLVENTLAPFGNQEEGCQAVDLYHRAQRMLIEARIKLLEAVTAKPGDPLAGKVALIQAQIEGIEQSLATFEGKVVRAAATVKIGLRLPTALQDARRRLGFNDGDETHLVDIVALRLSPSTLEHLELSEILRRRTGIGVFEAEWSVRPFELSRGQFGFSELPAHTESRPFPGELSVSQPVSLYTYCALRTSQERRPESPLLPLSVGFSVAAWEDTRGPRLDEWVLYHRRLEPEAWTLVASLPAAEPAEGRLKPDPGEPRLYPGVGVYRPRHFVLEIAKEVSKNPKTKE